jgi:hypothetical protein
MGKSITDLSSVTIVGLDLKYEAKVSGSGGYFIWLERRAVDQLYALRQRDVILRVAAMEAARPGKRRWRL